MPRLPDATTIGRRPSARTRQLPNFGAASGLVRAAETSGQGLVQAGQGIQRAGDDLFRAEQRAQSRVDAVARARAESAWQEQAEQALIRAETEQDLADPEVLGSIQQGLRESLDETLANFEGTEDARARLHVSLERRRSHLAGQATAKSVVAGKSAVADILGGRQSQLIGVVRSDQSRLGEARLQMREAIEEYGGALSPEEERAYLRAGDSMLIETALETMVAAGNVDTAQERMFNEPGLMRSLTPAATDRLFDKIDAYNKAIDEASFKGQAQRNYIASALGISADDVSDDMMKQSLGLVPKAEPLVEIGDSSSPTGSRFVRRSQALGQPGRPRTPLVDMSKPSAFETEIGKLDAKEIAERRGAAEVARLSLAQLDRISAAVDSGKFTTGVFSDTRTFLSQLAEFVNAPEELQKLIGAAETSDTLDAASARLGVEMAQRLSRVTNMSLTLIQRALPNLTRTPEGNRIIVETMRRSAEREIQISAIADDYVGQHRTLYPEGHPTFFQRIRDLEAADPVISKDLRDRIISEGGQAPKTWELKAESDIPAGWEHAGTTPDGKMVIRNLKTGQRAIKGAGDGGP